MVASANTTNTALTQKLSIQSQEFANDSIAIRSLDWDRSRFDIEFGLRNGTTYNSFVIKGKELAIIDTSHLKFEKLWFEELIKKHSNEGDIVLDCFLGSGTTAVAAMNTKRDFIGCELDKEYFEKTIMRINHVRASD